MQQLSPDFLQRIAGLPATKPLATKKPGLQKRRAAPDSVSQAAQSGDINQLLSQLEPELSPRTAGYTGQAVGSSFADVLGSLGSLYSASKGGPVQNPTMRHRDFLSMYEKKLDEYEQQKRSHDMLVAQQAINDIISQRQRDWNKADRKELYDLQVLDKEIDTDNKYRREDDVYARAKTDREATDLLEHNRAIERARVASELRKDEYAKQAEIWPERYSPRTSSTRSETLDLYDQSGTLRYSLNHGQVNKVSEMIIAKLRENVSSITDPRDKDIVIRGIRGQISRTEREELIYRHFDIDPAIQRFLGDGSRQQEATSRNQARFQQNSDLLQKVAGKNQGNDPLDLRL